MLGRAVQSAPLANLARCHARTIAVGAKFPDVNVHKASWPPTAFNVAEHISSKKVIIVGLPGAFTPT